ncbi:hypothetical protein CK203_085854 [Vitis vinifera]|uniref:DUF659 domain-containing protein n=1 Tax=Vitis vinifera TaxID=29760 RepID=A0A438DIE6_VITVI|nr:hypothetical protein CK203_085854 [Vitis vinifera]
MFKYLDEVVEEIEEENDVQVITDNASNYVNVGMGLMEKRRRLWWTPCVAHNEIDSDDEWIVEKETPIIPPDLCLLEDNELFNVDVVKVVSSKDQETQVSLDSIISSHSNKKET